MSLGMKSFRRGGCGGSKGIMEISKCSRNGWLNPENELVR